MIALSVNPIDIHDEWIKDIKSYGKISKDGFPYPIIEDPEREIAKTLGMLDPDELDKTGIPLTCRAVILFVKSVKIL
jgi:peroxiredoxin 6